MTQIDNLYEEIGACKNALGNVGTAGVIVNTGNVIINGGEGPQGNIPQFANTGATEYQYWVIARNASQKASNPLYIGRAKTNGSGNIAVTFYSPLSMSDFTIVRATGDVNTSVPTGTGNYAVAIDAQASSACDSNHLCRVADTQETLKSYTMPTASGKPGWFPILPMGVGGLILGGTGSTTSAINAAEATLNINQYNRIAWRVLIIRSCSVSSV
jgi:hypothetical protein